MLSYDTLARQCLISPPERIGWGVVDNYWYTASALAQRTLPARRVLQISDKCETSATFPKEAVWPCCVINVRSCERALVPTLWWQCEV